MPLPSRVDVLRTSFTLGWLVLALGTLSWKAPWFWRAASHAIETTSMAPPAATGQPGDTRAADEYRAAPADAHAAAAIAAGRAARAHRAALLSAASDPHRSIATGSPGPQRSASDGIRDDLLVAAARHEQAQRFDAAIQSYRFIEAIDGTLTPEEQLRRARALQWSGQPARAAEAFERYLASLGADDVDVRGELGLALTDAGRHAEALPHLDAAVASRPGDASLHLGAATAASALGRSSRAADALLSLAEIRVLTPDEAMWLTGQIEAAGGVERGLPAVYAALEAAPDAYPLWERAGDLEWTAARFDQAHDAWAHVPQDCRHGSVVLKAARAAARAGRTASSARSYAAATSCEPTAPVLLEAARLHGSLGDAERALPYYEAYAAATEPPAGVWLEMSQTALAAGEPGLALAWADAGLAGGGNASALRFARAQALQMLNRPAEADATLATLVREEPRNGAWLTWQGRAAFAQGRHLAAVQLFSRALGTTLEDRAAVLVEHGDAAAARGDFARARASYLSARSLARNPEDYDIDTRLDAVSQAVRPDLRLPVEWLEDRNGVSVVQGGGELVLHPAAAMRLRMRWTAGAIEQDDTRFNRQGLMLRMEDLFLTPAVRLDAGAGVERYSGTSVPVWAVAVRQDLASGGGFALQAIRQTPWSAETRLGTPRYNRISDLEALGAAFHSTGARGLMELPLPARHSIRLDGGWQRYSDGNRQIDAYLHVQREILSRPDGTLWIALQPQVYYESWAARRDAYFSPGMHVGAGLGLRAQLKPGAWTVDATATPQMLSSDGGRGLGLFASGGISRRVGPLWLGADATLFDDRRSHYRVHRVAAEVRVPLGR